MATTHQKIDAQFPEKLGFLFEPKRYKVAYGGRGGAKSWGVARALLIKAAHQPLRILCARETQKSIADSVHKLLSDQIEALNLSSRFQILNHSIRGTNGSEFIFAGIKQNVNNMKSYEGCDIAWVEEAATVSKNSWDVLIPTIRKEGSEIWLTFNPELESDVTYQRFVVNPPINSKVVLINWRDNPWLPQILKDEMADLRSRDPDAADHVYEGDCKQTIEGAIYKTEITLAEREHRITRVPYDAGYPVHTFWDLGFGDATTVWFVQSMPFEFRVIDYLASELQPLAYYIKALKEKPYAYGTHYLPWDGKKTELGSGRSIEEQLKKHFNSVKSAKKMSIEDGIAAVRMIFGRCWFDADRCADGLQALRHYRFERDESLQTFSRTPLHDWASHGADGFRTMGVSIKDLQRPTPRSSESSQPPNGYHTPAGDAAWMS